MNNNNNDGSYSSSFAVKSMDGMTSSELGAYVTQLQAIVRKADKKQYGSFGDQLATEKIIGQVRSQLQTYQNRYHHFQQMAKLNDREKAHAEEYARRRVANERVNEMRKVSVEQRERASTLLGSAGGVPPYEASHDARIDALVRLLNGEGIQTRHLQHVGRTISVAGTPLTLWQDGSITWM